MNCGKCNLVLVKKGFNKYLDGSREQRYFCNQCKKYFYKKHGQPKYYSWDEQKVQFLKDNYKWESKDNLIKNIEKPWRAIQGMSERLRLRRCRRANREIIEIEGQKFNYTVNKAGYMLLWNWELGIEGKMSHRYIWESHNGPIPEGYHIHHRDGNPLNNRLENLQLAKKSHILQGQISKLAKKCFEIADEHGFWDRDSNGQPTRNIGEGLMLISSELGEAMEAYRESDLEGLEEELADAIIRIFDLSWGMKLNIEKRIMDKIEYNKTRPDLHNKSL